MVRFKPVSPEYDCTQRNGFNSTMVRFKHAAAGNWLSCEVVSIPRWFDSSLILRGRILMLFVVSIPRWFDSSPLYRCSAGSLRTRFNSTMVRFKLDSREGTAKTGNTVSIPRWFDSSSPSYSIPLPSPSFQFHDGSIQAEFDINPRSWRAFVSIPRWFDSSISRSTVSRLAIISFQFHDGSIQAAVWDTAKQMQSLVSIPRWFDSSEVSPRNSRLIFSFQFHDGSIQASEQPASHDRFQLVSIPRWFDSSLLIQSQIGWQAMFQFHDGSIQANDSPVHCEISLISFNSTMVRFKPGARTSSLGTCL